MSEPTPVQVSLDVLHAALTRPELSTVGSAPVLITPKGEVQDLSHLLDAPQRIERVIHAHRIEGFITYVNQYKHEATKVYSAAAQDARVEARIDDHDAPDEGEKRSWVRHKACFDCPTTPEWDAWNGHNKQRCNQVEFAEFLENNLDDITAPVAADLMTAVLEFQDTSRVEFKSHARLSDGRVQFTYAEKDEGGEIKFPDRLEIGVPILEGMKYRYKVQARVRYRMREGNLSIWYELHKPEHVLRKAYEDLLEHIEKETGIYVHRAR